MGINNQWVFTKTIIEWDKISKATRNQYRVISVKDYTDKKQKLPDGLNITLQIIHDDMDYGVDKNGKARENNELMTFNVTVLNRKHQVQKGDIISLLDFDPENSFVIGFDMLLRFNDLKILQSSKG